MKVVFDHIEGWGKVAGEDFIYAAPQGIPEPGDDPDALLAEGWVPWQDSWYNLRSVRICVQDYLPSKTTRRLRRQIGTVMRLHVDDFSRYLPIYEKYCSHHGFERDINLDDFKGCHVLEYHHECTLVGASIFSLIGSRSMVVYQFLWDYEKPSLSLGKVAQLFECQAAYEAGRDYVYLMGGYELCSAYKMDYRGAEWWTGKEWSQDANLYKVLCHRDDDIKLILW